MLNQSFCIQLPWHNVDVLPIIKVNYAYLLWCPPCHFRRNGRHVQSERCYIFLDFPVVCLMTIKCDNHSLGDLMGKLSQKKLHSSSDSPTFRKHWGRNQDNIRADKTLGRLPCTQHESIRLRYPHIQTLPYRFLEIPTWLAVFMAHSLCALVQSMLSMQRDGRQ